MTPAGTERWIAQDKAHGWHPFTPQDQWCDAAHDPLVLVSGSGVWLTDSEGNTYIDGNSSIWTNIHGHSNPRLTAALVSQAEKVAHTSYLGFANPVASELAAELCGLFPKNRLERCFFSDDGSTAIECALKMTLQARQQTGEEGRIGIVAFDNAYHGDTMGAASLGGVTRFMGRLDGLGLPVTRVRDMAALSDLDAGEISAVIIEPVIQGVNEMTPWPVGMLRELREWCTERGVHLILDEVMTGFGRTGRLFACQLEDVIPDFLCLAKGLTGGYAPLAATLTTGAVYDAFRGGAENAFYYGHSYTGNQLGCALALESLAIFRDEQVLEKLEERIETFTRLLGELARHRSIKEVRQVGLIAGVELAEGDGVAVCLAMREHGVLTRPIRNTIVLMPPLSISDEELELLVGALERSL